jgi:glycosyltransferase involved in cell wall biosynthesis
MAEYALFLNRNKARAFYYDDLKQLDPQLFKVLEAANLLALGLPKAVHSVAPPVEMILAISEEVGLPLALDIQARKLRIPVYIITHGFLVRTSRTMETVRLMENVRFLCLSEQLKELLVDRFKVPESRVQNVGYGVDVRFFYPVEAPCARPTIVSAGAANRDYRTLVQAVRSLNAEVKIAADSAWYPTRIDIERDRLPANVEARSYKDYINLRQLYAKASFVVVPLRQAQFACGYAVILEAMAMGRPVIATKTESHGDFIIDGETGYYVRPGDDGDLREKIEHLLANPELAQQMGKRARIRVERHFSCEVYCERLERAIAPAE